MDTYLLEMLLDEDLFLRIAEEAAKSPRLRKNYDLRDSEQENSQRMLNVLLPGTKTTIHRHRDTSEVVICIYGSAIEKFYDSEGNETECIKMQAGTRVPGVVVEKDRFHSLEATDEIGVVCGFKAGKYTQLKKEDTIGDW